MRRQRAELHGKSLLQHGTALAIPITVQELNDVAVRTRLAALLRLRERFERERAELEVHDPTRAHTVTEALADLEVLITRLRQAERRAS